MTAELSGDDRSPTERARRIAAVTGSSSGIGKSIAMRLAACGHDVVLHGRQPSDHLNNVEQEILALDSGGSHSIRVAKVYGDFSSEDMDWQRFVADAWDALGPIDCWVNNAGGDVLTGDASQWSMQQKLTYLWRTDVVSSLMLSRIVGRRMQTDCGAKGAGYGAIINIGWDQAEQGMEGDSGELFATTKGAIMAMTRSLAQTLGPAVRVNCVAPGWIQTAWGQQTSEYWDRRAQHDSLMQRWGTPEDIANAVTFLSHPDSSFISGQILTINGGFSFGHK